VLARFSFWIFGLAVLMVAIAPPTHAEPKRVALVIGNAAYKHAAELRNPRNDAQDVAAALEKLGFEVITEFDLDQTGIRRAIGRFAVAIENATIAVFYYAGHGMSLNGTNYLLPTDSKLENQYSPELEMVPFTMVQRVMENKPRTSILFFDACRDNPLARNLTRAMGTRSAGVTPGLSWTEAGTGTLISFSTQPGAVAQDGTGRNSPFATALVRQLNSSNLSVADLLVDVRRDVMQATNDRQVPWEHSSLRDRFFFSPPKPVSIAPPPPPPKPEVEKGPIELTPAQKSALARRLNRELKRVGCDPGVSDGSWPTSSQDALQQFASATQHALYTDEPTQAALDALTSQKMMVCPMRPVATPPAPDKPVDPPVVASPSPAIATPPTTTIPVAATPPPKFTAPPAMTEPAAAAPRPADVSPPAAAVAPVVVAPTPPATPPTAAALPGPDVPPASATPPATAKPPKAEPRPLPRAAAVKSPPSPSPPPTAPQAPFATSIQRESACRTETEAECRARLGLEQFSGLATRQNCSVAERKEICPGSRPAASKPSQATRVQREKKCRLETERECLIRQGLGHHVVGISRQFCGPDALRTKCD
jgi:hypothetical protein